MVGSGESKGGSSVDTVSKGSSCVVDSMVSHGMVSHRGGVHERSSMVDSVVCKRSSVDERGGVVNGVMGDRGGVDEGGSVVDDGLVGAGDALVFNIGVVLLVLIHKVVNNLSPAVRKVDHILALDNGTLADLSAGVLVGVAISVNAVHVVTKLVIMGDLLIGGSVDKRGSMVDSVVSNWRGMVDSVVSNWGGVDEGSSVMDGMVGHRGGVNKGGSVVDGVMGHRGGMDEGGSVRHRGDIGSWGVAVSWDLGHGGCHQGRGNEEQLHLGWSVED